MLDKRPVYVRKARSRKMQILIAHLGKFCHNHVHYLVASAEMMVK